ncbi:MAG: Coenzyme F420 hydrogenase/dehydrogenase, beta subunit C-terminal domain [Rikenellaceae bacterium]
MIKIKEKKDCCGCTACYAACPTQCISMEEDHEGFLYPTVDSTRCIECGLCLKVCPVINKATARKPLEVLAAKNRDESVRSQSSSGGLFSILASKVIDKDGIVFGARFNSEWEVEHSSAQTMSEAAAFRGSKYVQSRVGDTFRQAKELLDAGHHVLYSGTPCQIAGLRGYLGRDYENLLAVDFICHGTPSPKVWRQYLDHIASTKLQGDRSKITAISFRDKSKSWKRFRLTILAENSTPILSQAVDSNPYEQGFLKGIYLRPSCHECPSRELKSGSDITLADYWGIEKVAARFDDNRGTSLVMVNTQKGALLLSELKLLDIEAVETTYSQAVASNKGAITSKPASKHRAEFFRHIDTNMMECLASLLHLPLHTRIARAVKLWFMDHKL